MASVRISCGPTGSRSSSAAPLTSTTPITMAAPKGQPTAARTPLLTLKAVAEYFSVSERTVHRWVHEGILPVVRLKNLLRFHALDIERFAQSSSVESAINEDIHGYISHQLGSNGAVS